MKIVLRQHVKQEGFENRYSKSFRLLLSNLSRNIVWNFDFRLTLIVHKKDLRWIIIEPLWLQWTCKQEAISWAISKCIYQGMLKSYRLYFKACIVNKTKLNCYALNTWQEIPIWNYYNSVESNREQNNILRTNVLKMVKELTERAYNNNLQTLIPHKRIKTVRTPDE